MLAIPGGAFDGLGQLRLQDLNYNNLKTVNRNMFKHLSRLEILILTNNHLETIPGDNFDSLTQLKYLNS